MLDPELDGAPHPSCSANLCLGLARFGVAPDQISTTFDIFMNVWSERCGVLHIDPPTSRAGTAGPASARRLDRPARRAAWHAARVKHFLLGVACTVAVMVVGVLVVFLSLGSEASTSAAPTPTPSAASTPLPAPADLAPEETWLGAAELRSRDVVSADGNLTDVVARGSGVRFSAEGLRADQLAIDATIPFTTVAEQVGQGVTVYDAGQGLAGVQRTITVLGREVPVRATGAVSADGGELLIEPETVELFGASFLDSAASALARSLVTIREPVAGVPAGMTLTSVSVTPEGFDASLAGRDVVITQ